MSLEEPTSRMNMGSAARPAVPCGWCAARRAEPGSWLRARVTMFPPVGLAAARSPGDRPEDVVDAAALPGRRVGQSGSRAGLVLGGLRWPLRPARRPPWWRFASGPARRTRPLGRPGRTPGTAGRAGPVPGSARSGGRRPGRGHTARTRSTPSRCLPRSDGPGWRRAGSPPAPRHRNCGPDTGPGGRGWYPELAVAGRDRHRCSM